MHRVTYVGLLLSLCFLAPLLPTASAPPASASQDEVRLIARQGVGYPEMGREVELRLTDDGQVPAAAPFDGTAAHAGCVSFRGTLLTLDAYYVGLESTTGTRIWVPREHVAHVIAQPTGGSAR